MTSLTDIFIVPPISVLDVKQAYWKNRQWHWLKDGRIKSELGRNDNLLSLSKLMQTKHSGTSIFSPVLCEIMYLWFTGPGDLVLDPFAGGSVRGIVAGTLGRHYYGTELREEQVRHNRVQAEDIKPKVMPRWRVGDASKLPIRESRYDFVFTCPPYWNLEVYSDHERDMSNMGLNDFWVAYRKAIRRSVACLKDDRFAAIVVGDVRDSNGHYVDMVGKTVRYFSQAGCHFYNQMILLQEPSTAAMRATKFMNRSRKVPKAHQNVLVFVKGSALAATERLPKFSAPDSLFEDELMDDNPYDTLF